MYRVAEVRVEGGSLLRFRCGGDLALSVQDLCIVEEDGNQEYGRVLTLSEPRENGEGPRGKVLRRATLQDRAKAEENVRFARMARSECLAKVHAGKTPIKILQVHYNFDRSVLFIVFSSEEKVDLRELVRELSDKVKARITLRQIGVRDAAGVVGGVGGCGRSLCCCTFLKAFESVNVKMAKTQGLAMNPTTITGQCGRLKCCLRYEFEAYRDADRGMPRQGACVRCSGGQGRVIEKNVLSRRVKVMLEDRRVVSVSADEVEVAGRQAGSETHEENEDPGAERAEP